jgi:hypothetical protein
MRAKGREKETGRWSRKEIRLWGSRDGKERREGGIMT